MTCVCCAEGLEGKTHVTDYSEFDLFLDLGFLRGTLNEATVSQEVRDVLDQVISFILYTNRTPQSERTAVATSDATIERALPHDEQPASQREVTEPDEVKLVPFEPNPAPLSDYPASPPLPKPRKERLPWTEEQKEAARARMAKARAAKAARQASPAESESAPQQQFSQTLRSSAPIEKPLQESEWPDIKQMIATGRSREAIAYDLDVPVEHLDQVIENQLRKRATPLGEARALSSSA
jgi:hypothetical protein